MAVWQSSTMTLSSFGRRALTSPCQLLSFYSVTHINECRTVRATSCVLALQSSIRSCSLTNCLQCSNNLTCRCPVVVCRDFNIHVDDKRDVYTVRLTKLNAAAQVVSGTKKYARGLTLFASLWATLAWCGRLSHIQAWGHGVQVLAWPGTGLPVWAMWSLKLLNDSIFVPPAAIYLLFHGFSQTHTAIAPLLSLDQQHGTCSMAVGMNQTYKSTAFVACWRSSSLNSTLHIKHFRGVIFAMMRCINTCANWLFSSYSEDVSFWTVLGTSSALEALNLSDDALYKLTFTLTLTSDPGYFPSSVMNRIVRIWFRVKVTVSVNRVRVRIRIRVSYYC